MKHFTFLQMLQNILQLFQNVEHMLKIGGGYIKNLK